MKKHITTIFLLALSLNFVPVLVHEASARIELVDVEAQQIKVTFSDNYNSLCVTGAAGKVLRVYNILGVPVTTYKIDGNEKTIDLSNLSVGAYLIKVGDVTKKIKLRSR